MCTQSVISPFSSFTGPPSIQVMQPLLLDLPLVGNQRSSHIIHWVKFVLKSFMCKTHTKTLLFPLSTLTVEARFSYIFQPVIKSTDRIGIWRLCCPARCFQINLCCAQKLFFGTHILRSLIFLLLIVNEWCKVDIF